MPVVSVVIAVYNGEAHLRETVASVLSQTLTDFECLIIDDGSTDATADILATLTDSRIVVMRNQQNEGLPYSLNRGLKQAHGTYIARLDVGDLAVLDRLEKQVFFLETHPEIGIVGSWCQLIDESGNDVRIERFPVDDLDIRWTLLLRNPFLHPAVMLRRSVLEKHRLRYEPTFRASQDYELWTRVLEYTQGANLSDVLVAYRLSSESITAQSKMQQLQNHDLVAFRTICQQFPGFSISQDQISQLREAFAGGTISKDRRKAEVVRLSGTYLDVLAAFAQKYVNHPNAQRLQHRETARIASKVFRWRYHSYWIPALHRVIRLYPWFFVPLLHKRFRHAWKRVQTKYALI